jgi:hypothetical protein
MIYKNMGNIISDITISEQIKSNIQNIQKKYEVRGAIELYFASVIKSNSWDRFISKCSKIINLQWKPPIAEPGTFRLMCEFAMKKLSDIIGSESFDDFMNNIKPFNRPYALDSVMILLDFPIGFDTAAVISDEPIDQLLAIREIYADNMICLQVDQFKYDSNNSDSDILQNVFNATGNIKYRVSDALQLVNIIPSHGVYRKLI